MGKAEAANEHGPQLRKTLFQVRYKPYFRFYDLLMTAAEKLGDYHDWQTNGLSVVLQDYEKHCSISIAPTGITYEQDSADLDIEVIRIPQFLELLRPALEIPSFNRFGFRRQYLVPVDMGFESLVTVLNAKFLSQAEPLRRILPSQIEALLYRVDATEEDDQYHLSVGPTRKKEIPQLIVFNRQHHLDPNKSEEEQRSILGQLPDVAIFIDIDLYRTSEQLLVEDALGVLKTRTYCE